MAYSPREVRSLQIAIALVLIFAARGGFAEEGVYRTGSLRYDVATTALRSDDGRGRLEIEVSIPYEQLQFVAEGASYTARYQLSAIVRDAAGNQVAGDVWRASSDPEPYEETQRLWRFLTGRHSLSLNPGRYQLTVMLEDLNSNREGTLSKELQIPDLSYGTLQMSEITFINPEGLVFAGDDSAASLLTAREEWRPFPKRRYDETHEEALFSYELYRDSPEPGTITEEWYVIDAQGQVILRSRAEMEVSGKVVRLGRVPLERFGLGPHTLIVRLEDEGTQRVAFTEATFTVAASFFASREEYEERVDQLEYVATSAEQERLKSAPPDEWVKLWNEFWKSFDPTPNTERNEQMLEYFRRVDYANEHFLGPFGGWRSDMGRIHIRLGPPNEIERHYFELDSNPYEIWYYYALGEEFIFVDERGFGEYTLVYPLDEGY